MAQTLADYLQVLDNYSLSDNTLDRIVVKCNSLYGFTITGTTVLVSTLSTMELDLCEAWAWISATGIVGTNSGMKKTVGNRSVSYASFNPTDADCANWLANANRIFAKYGYPTVEGGQTAFIEDYSILW